MTAPSTADWNPTQYARFRDERARPFYDLLELVQSQPAMRVVDLGCGTGELTRLLHRHIDSIATLGIDSSPAMLAAAAEFAGDGLTFRQGDIADFPGAAEVGAFDLVFSNAALHWLPDQDALLTRIADALTPRGQLAVQIPANHDHPSHLVAAEVASESPFREALAGYTRESPVLTPEAYASLLDRLGFREQTVRLQVYGHHLAARDEVIEWVKGTLLTDYQRRLPPELWTAFLDRYRERLLPRLDDSRPYFYPFKRILFWAAR